jgi:hypothetical protein
MNLGQDITMQAVAGQTVKPGQVLKRQICDILVRVWWWWAAPAGDYGGIWLRNRGFPALTNGSGDDPLKVLFTNSGRNRSYNGRRLHESPAIAKSGRANDVPPHPANFRSPAAADAPSKLLMSLSFLAHLPNSNRPEVVL